MSDKKELTKSQKGKADNKKVTAEALKSQKQESIDLTKEQEMVKFKSNGMSKFMNRKDKIHHVTRQTARLLSEKGLGIVVK